MPLTCLLPNVQSVSVSIVELYFACQTLLLIDIFVNSFDSDKLTASVQLSTATLDRATLFLQRLQDVQVNLDHANEVGMARSSIEEHPQDAQKYTNLPTRLSCHQSRVHELEQLLLHHQLRVRELEHLLLHQESRVFEVERLLYEQELDHSRRAQEVDKSGIEAEYLYDRYCIS